MPDDPGPNGRLQLHAEAESRPVESRSAEGQRLDEARAEFQTAWQAKIREKQAAVARARGIGAWLKTIREMAFVLGLALGACLGAMLGAIVLGIAGFAAGVLLGGVFSFLAVSPLMGLAAYGEWYWQKRAERFERDVQEVERQKPLSACASSDPAGQF